MKHCSRCGAPLEFECKGDSYLYWYRRLIFDSPRSNFWFDDTSKEIKEFSRLMTYPKSYLLCMGCTLEVNKLLNDFFEEDKDGCNYDQCDCG